MTPLRAQLVTHGCVLVWGFTAILGKVITLTALDLVVWRMAITALCLAMMARAWVSVRTFAKADYPAIALAGTLIALHWVSFYASVKLSNASIGVLCIALAPIFSALLSPWMSQDRFDWREFALSLSVLPGMALVVGGVDTRFYAGIGMGALAALLVAMFALVNKKLVARFDVLPLSFLQISIGCIVVLPIALIAGGGHIARPSAHDWPYLLVFAIVCTALPFSLAAAALRSISAFSAQFAVNLEPVYGIVFAAWLLNETAQLTPRFYWGAAMILLAVFLQAGLSLRKPR
jgi:drug/metabolite transporter (DMT)-like permease